MGSIAIFFIWNLDSIRNAKVMHCADSAHAFSTVSQIDPALTLPDLDTVFSLASLRRSAALEEEHPPTPSTLTEPSTTVHSTTMRPAVVACVLLATTATTSAVRLLLRAARSPSDEASRSAPSRRRSDESSELPIVYNAHVTRLLDLVCAPISGSTFVAEHGNDHDCICCLDRLSSDGPSVRVLPGCKHAFHATCLEQWVQYTAAPAMHWCNFIILNDHTLVYHGALPSCPLCNRKLPVLPHLAVRKAMLVAVAKSLGLPDLATANFYINSGLVHIANHDTEDAGGGLWALLQSQGYTYDQNMSFVNAATTSGFTRILDASANDIFYPQPGGAAAITSTSSLTATTAPPWVPLRSPPVIHH